MVKQFVAIVAIVPLVVVVNQMTQKQFSNVFNVPTLNANVNRIFIPNRCEKSRHNKYL